MRLRFSVPLFFFCCVFVHGVFAGPFPPPGMSLPEYWGEEHVWWDGRAAFHGEVV
ncbi:fimbrial protein, partial [Escherichia coli]